jgi:hypothetical protein
MQDRAAADALEGAADAAGDGAGPGDDAAEDARESSSSLNSIAFPSERPTLFSASNVIFVTTLFVMFSFLQAARERM